MPSFTPRLLLLLLALTVIWGVNWPVMKLGLREFPPLSFRAVSLWMAIPIVGLVVSVLGQPLRVPRSFWPQLAKLTVFNMLLWHALIVLAIPTLSSGRAAILGYTMPIFSAVLGSVVFGDHLARRGWLGVCAALGGVLLLLWHEMGALGSKPQGVLLMLVAAASWAWGTQLMRRTPAPVPVLTMSFWMTIIAACVLGLLAWCLERDRWQIPSAPVMGTLVFNGVLVLGLAQGVWFVMARQLPPVASTLSVMMIPVLGVFTGAWWLGEVLHWQDWTAVGLMVLAIASVLWPGKTSPQTPQPASRAQER